MLRRTLLKPGATCSAKRLLAAWRVLIGVWGPRDWDIPVASLKNYTKFIPPPPNPWLDVNKPPKDAPPAEVKPAEESKPMQPVRQVASRHLVRHVLRARINAAHSLSKFLLEIKHSNGDVCASAHLAARFNSSTMFYNGDGAQAPCGEGVKTCPPAYQFLPVNGPTRTRSAKEVIMYLKDHGAQIGNLDDVGEGDWAAEHLSSGDEGAEVSDSDCPCIPLRTLTFTGFYLDRMKRKLRSKSILFPLGRISLAAHVYLGRKTRSVSYSDLSGKFPIWMICMDARTANCCLATVTCLLGHGPSKFRRVATFCGQPR